MRDVPLNLLIDIVMLAAAAGTVLYWIASRKRIAADTVGRAQEQAAQIRREAERDAESIRTSARLEGKEQAHEMLMDAERQARERRQEIVQLERTLAEQRRELQRLAGMTAEEARQYPGQIKVTVIRETRAVDYAR